MAYHSISWYNIFYHGIPPSYHVKRCHTMIDNAITMVYCGIPWYTIVSSEYRTFGISSCPHSYELGRLRHIVRSGRPPDCLPRSCPRSITAPLRCGSAAQADVALCCCELQRCAIDIIFKQFERNVSTLQTVLTASYNIRCG